MQKILKKFLQFVLVSGVGWLIDFGIYTVLTRLCAFPVAGANYLSSMVSVTFVFFVSTKKILETRGGSWWRKYLLYVLYQLLLITAVSFLAQWIDRLLHGWTLLCSVPLLRRNTALLSKILITPITMVCNFFVLRRIAEGKRE